MIEKIPKEIKTSWMTFIFSYGENILLNPSVLVSKSKGNALFLLNISEQNK